MELAGTAEKHAHGNVRLFGTGALADRLCAEIRSKLGIAHLRGDRFGYLQRSFPQAWMRPSGCAAAGPTRTYGWTATLRAVLGQPEPDAMLSERKKLGTGVRSILDTQTVKAAKILASVPAAMQPRYLQTLTAIGAEQDSTVVLPRPIDVIEPFRDLFGKAGKPAGGRPGSGRFSPAAGRRSADRA